MCLPHAYHLCASAGWDLVQHDAGGLHRSVWRTDLGTRHPDRNLQEHTEGINILVRVHNPCAWVPKTMSVCL